MHESRCHKKFAFASCLGDDEEVTCLFRFRSVSGTGRTSLMLIQGVFSTLILAVVLCGGSPTPHSLALSAPVNVTVVTFLPLTGAFGDFGIAGQVAALLAAADVNADTTLLPPGVRPTPTPRVHCTTSHNRTTHPSQHKCSRLTLLPATDSRCYLPLLCLSLWLASLSSGSLCFTLIWLASDSSGSLRF